MSPEPRFGRGRRGRRAPIVYTGVPDASTSKADKPQTEVPAAEVLPSDLPREDEPEKLQAPSRASVGLEDLMELLEMAELDCPRKSLAPLQRYLIRMLEENEKLNLSGIKDLHEALALHLVDSLFVWQAVAKSPRLILDIGSGNGFPGVVAAGLWPKARVILVERRQKKAAAIAICAKDAGLRNVETMALDAAQLPTLHPELCHACDMVLSRATASLGAIAKLAAPLLRSQGLLVQWKAIQFSEEERRDYERQQKRLQLKSREDLIYVIQASEPRPRRLVSALKT